MLYIAEHRGFAGIEREACRAFFQHYNLDPPVTPMLQPELANPLYLKLVCQTLKSKGLKSLPAGWTGLATAIRAFLEEKNRVIAAECEVSEGTAIASRSLTAIAREISRTGQTALSWSAADSIVRKLVALPATVQPIQWLIREDLLIEDAPAGGDLIDAESVVRPSFERLGDFVIAKALLSGIRVDDFAAACAAGGALAPYLGSVNAVADNEGVVSALSILVPEEFSPGTELPDFFNEEPVRSAVMKASIASYASRDPSTFTQKSENNLREALAMPDHSYEAMNSVLAISCESSRIDAHWLDSLLNQKRLAKRDAYWVGYLHKSYEDQGQVRRLIDSADDLPLGEMTDIVAERWAIVLLWFTAAADRRVKDSASRAVTALLRGRKNVVHIVVRRMLRNDDDAVRERTLLTAYGACILSKDASVVAATCDAVTESMGKDPTRFHNALLRDHARSLAELGELLGVSAAPKALVATLDALKSPWPLELPTDDQIKSWDNLPKLAHSCLDDDFFVYSMHCLEEWTGTIPKPDMAKWILRRIVEDFGYAGSGCEQYDHYMLGSHGGGRGRPAWAERIGKKYQWIAMYQLAARLSDHAVRERDEWEPEPLRKPLTLIEERQFDPTLPRNLADRDERATCWWIPTRIDLAANANLTDEAWVKNHDDVPTLSRLLQLAKGCALDIPAY